MSGSAEGGLLARLLDRVDEDVGLLLEVVPARAVGVRDGAGAPVGS